jgi:hypothetical protein
LLKIIELENKNKKTEEREAVPGTGGGKPVDGPLAGAATG